MGEIYLKLETADLKSHESIFAIGFLMPDGSKRQLLPRTEVEPSDSTLKYLGMDRETFGEIQSVHATPRHVAAHEFSAIVSKLPERPVLYVWNQWTAERLMGFLEAYNFKYYSYFKMTPISISDLHKFYSRDEEGVIHSRAKEVFEKHGIEDTYLHSMRKLVDIYKRGM